MSGELAPAAKAIAAEMGRSIGRGLEVMAASLAKLAGRAGPRPQQDEPVRRPGQSYSFMNVVDQEGNAVPATRNADGSWTCMVPDGVTGLSGCLITVKPWTTEDSLAESQYLARMMGPPNSQSQPD